MHTPKHGIIGKTFQIIISTNSINVISRSYMQHDIPNLWRTLVIHALQIHAISWNLLNVITRSHMHTWHSEPLGNSCYTCTPNTCHLIECKCKLVEYHYAYVFCSIPENICILICLAWNPFSKSCHTSPCYACSCFIFLFLCLQDLNPRICFSCQEHQLSSLTLVLKSGALTLWSYCFWYQKHQLFGLRLALLVRHQPQGLFSVHQTISYANHLISCFFINHHQNLHHITFLNPHVLRHNLKAHTSSKHHFNIIKAIHMHITYKNTIGSRLLNHSIFFA